MKYLTFLILILYGANSLAENKYMSKLAGTWQLYKANGTEVSAEFYMRLESNGDAETWPIPKCWGDEKTSKGQYEANKKEKEKEKGR